MLTAWVRWMRFRTEARRGSLGFGKINNNLYLFNIPEQFKDKESLTFIWNEGGENSSSWNNNGFYVIQNILNKNRF